MDEELSKRGPGRPPKPETKPVRLMRNYVPMAGIEKKMAGETVDLPIEEARRAVKLGIAERADEF